MKNYSKILIVSIFLYIFSVANCFAEYNWKKIGTNIDGDVSYVDLSSIKKVGNNIFYFNLMDYIKPTNQGVLSAKNYFEVNCLDLSYRYIKDFYYKEPMGNGEYTIFDEIGEWENNTKGSIGDKVRKFVCNYK
jgi:hypothetical protein